MSSVAYGKFLLFYSMVVDWKASIHYSRRLQQALTRFIVFFGRGVQKRCAAEKTFGMVNSNGSVLLYWYGKISYTTIGAYRL